MKQKTVLIVDDDEKTAEILGLILEGFQFEVSVAHTGTQALKMIEEQHPASVILDISLADEVNGLDVAREIRRNAETADALVIAYSGHCNEQYYELAKAAGMDYFL